MADGPPCHRRIFLSRLGRADLYHRGAAAVEQRVSLDRACRPPFALPSFSSLPRKKHLDEVERSAVAGLLREHLRTARYPLAPLKSAYAKLAPHGDPPIPPLREAPAWRDAFVTTLRGTWKRR